MGEGAEQSLGGEYVRVLSTQEKGEDVLFVARNGAAAFVCQLIERRVGKDSSNPESLFEHILPSRSDHESCRMLYVVSACAAPLCNGATYSYALPLELEEGAIVPFETILFTHSPR